MIATWIPPIFVAFTGAVGVVLLAREVLWAHETEEALSGLSVLALYRELYSRGDWKGYARLAQEHFYGDPALANFIVEGKSPEDFEADVREHYATFDDSFSRVQAKVLFRSQPKVLKRRMVLLKFGVGLLVTSAVGNLLTLLT